MRTRKIVIGISPRIPIVIIILVVIAVFTRNFIKETQIKNQVSDARAEAETFDDKLMEDKIIYLKKAGIIKEKLASSKIDVCYIDHVGKAGEYFQQCQLQYVEGFTTDLDEDAVYATLRSLESTDPHVEDTSFFFGNEAKYGCSLYEMLLFKPDLFKFYENNSTYSGCETPKIFQRESIPNSVIRTYRSFDPESIGNSQNQIWISHMDKYYREELGCAFASIIFCDNPRKTPITAD